MTTSEERDESTNTDPVTQIENDKNHSESGEASQQEHHNAETEEDTASGGPAD